MPTPQLRGPVRPWRWALVVLVAAAVPVAVVKRLDEDNRFCVACHLHGEIMRNMTAMPLVTLAGAHFRARPAVASADAELGGPANEPPAVAFQGHPDRCFTCHSGEGVVGWTQVTALSAWDSARWLLGDRHEPTSMRLPITNDACLKCHMKQVHGSGTAEETDKFHELSDHSSMALACISCHQIHRTGEAARTWLHPDRVKPQCARCHKDMALSSGWN